VLVNGRYVMAPSPIPSFDNPKMHRMPALQLFGAGREKRLYAVPPYTDVMSLDFADRPFHIEPQGHACALCGCTTSYLDEVPLAGGETLWTCSDTDHCRGQQELQQQAQKGPQT
jgi:alpha-D-ribose 1-methylphosphonate 5-phosphate C-P lyase